MPEFANARSVRNALDRARLRQANRLFSGGRGPLSRDDLMTVEAADILASRVFSDEAAGAGPLDNRVAAEPEP
jgi:hypothetical protein